MTSATAPISTITGRSRSYRGSRLFFECGAKSGCTKFPVTARCWYLAVPLLRPGTPYRSAALAALKPARDIDRVRKSTALLLGDALERAHCTGIDRPVSATLPACRPAAPACATCHPGRRRMDLRSNSFRAEMKASNPDVQLAVAEAAWLGRSGGLHSRPLPMSAFSLQGETKGRYGNWQHMAQAGRSCVYGRSAD